MAHVTIAIRLNSGSKNVQISYAILAKIFAAGWRVARSMLIDEENLRSSPLALVR